ncbi:MAG: NTP transferase domain-containing protein [Lachnospiraceae bacterium]|nr:NTP transferase domain-containing protein [Lachnospiraceae bacterium]
MLKSLILAAGKGTRMKSDLPKVVHKCMGNPMVHYVIEASKIAGATDVCVIVGYKADEVKSAITADVKYAFQTEQLGTGHAVKCAGDFIGQEGDVIILCGDTPLITGDTLTKLYETHTKGGYGVTVLSAILDDATGYGRIVRDSAGEFAKIVEQKDATEEEKLVREINSGMYVFNAKALSEALDMINNDNAAGEYYLTDTIEIIKGMGMKVAAMPLSGSAIDEIRGVNTLEQLAEAEEIMKNR